MRWQTVRFSAVRYNYIRGSRITGDPVATWQSGLQQADKILQEAIEEAELGPPAPTPAQSLANPSGLTVNVNNVFSPVVHVTFTQLVTQLEELRLPPAEQEQALQHLRALEKETTDEQRWPVIARSLEAMKALGKGVYEKVALPLLVESLKQQMLTP